MDILNKKQLQKMVLVLSILFISQTLTAQVLWGKSYQSNSTTLEEGKGSFNGLTNRYIACGSNFSNAGVEQAFLLETDKTGAVTWQIAIGDSIHQWSANSVISTYSGDYVVVGKTTKAQTINGANDDSCNLKTQYYNAFIASVTPGSSTLNWIHVFGDSALNDEAIEVIQDQFGDFVVVGNSAGRFEGDSLCNNTNNVAPLYNDYSGVMVVKFLQHGTPFFNHNFQQNGYFDQGVSIVEDVQNLSYKILVNRRYSDNTSIYYPAVMDINLFGINLRCKEYMPYLWIDRIATDIVNLNNHIVLTGYILDYNRAPTTSFFMALDSQLNNINYSEVIHPFSNLINRDMIVDSNLIIVSGDILDSSGTQMDIYKIGYSPFTSFQIQNLAGGNISLQNMYNNTTNTSLCNFNEFDSSMGMVSGYHLFGKNGVHFKTNQMGISPCCITDSISLSDTFLMSNLYYPYLTPINLLDSGIAQFSNIVEYGRCDSLIVVVWGNSSQPAVDLKKTSIGGITIYPNPAKDVLYFSNIDKEKIKSISIINSQGKLMKNISENVLLDVNEISLNTISTGVYFLILETKKGEKTIHKLMIIK